MWFISDVLDAVATSILVLVFLFFLSIGSAWAILSYPINKLYEINRKLFTRRVNKVADSNTSGV